MLLVFNVLSEAFAPLLSATSQLYPISPLAQPCRGQPAPGRAHFPRLPAAIFIPSAPFDSLGMKEPLKKGADRRCSPARGSPAPQEGDRQQGHPTGTVPSSTSTAGSSRSCCSCSPPAQHNLCPSCYLAQGTSKKAPPASKGHSVFLHIPLFFFPGWCYFYFSVHTHGGCHSRWQEGSAPRGCRRGSSAPWLQPSRPSPQLHQLSCVVDGECTGEKAERHPVKSRKATMHRGGASHRGSVAPTTLLESLSLQERHFFSP